MTNSVNIKTKLMSNGFLEIIENLQFHHNKLVCERAINIFDWYILSENDF